MKTPMQEHIEWLKKEKDEHGYEKHPYFECAIEHAESMLEKEKEMIMRTYQDGLDNGFINGNWNLISYYNETFNTKER